MCTVRLGLIFPIFKNHLHINLQNNFQPNQSFMFSEYTGPWTFETAAHLLRRTTYGPRKERINQAVDEGFDQTFETLFAIPESVDPPIYFDFEEDPEAGIGESWVGKPYDSNIVSINFQRRKTIWAWWYRRMHQNDQTLTEKLTMFWHNHFVVSAAGSGNMVWQYLNKLRDGALGNFRDLTKQITVDKSMLIYLNGTTNLAEEPNENFARELLELFTIGKGPLAAPGDYTNYTEQDIASIARALTGWTAWTEEHLPAAYRAWAHDTGSKPLSHRFDNQVIQNNNENEYADVVDIIFQKDECAFHICRKIYTWFVHYNITPEVETEIITPMAEMLLANDYVIKEPLLALLKSEHFFDVAQRGCMIKNPMDFFFSSLSTFHVPPPENFLTENRFWVAWYWDFEELGMAIFQHPSVAGWAAYHQAPNYYRDWINSASLALRKRMMTQIKWLTQWIDDTAPGYTWIEFLETLENPTDVNDLIDEVCQLIFPRPMTQVQKDYFKDFLIPGLPDFEWTVEYNDFLNDPDDEDKRNAIFNKLNDFFFAMISVPEFQLS